MRALTSICPLSGGFEARSSKLWMLSELCFWLFCLDGWEDDSGGGIGAEVEKWSTNGYFGPSVSGPLREFESVSLVSPVRKKIPLHTVLSWILYCLKLFTDCNFLNFKVFAEEAGTKYAHANICDNLHYKLTMQWLYNVRRLIEVWKLKIETH